MRGAVLRDRRLRLALSQQALADEANVDVGVIKKIEGSEIASVYPTTVRKLADFFNCAPSDISERVTDQEEVA
jgi:transcriptional regulator with XRE-family HTH domain